MACKGRNPAVIKFMVKKPRTDGPPGQTQLQRQNYRARAIRKIAVTLLVGSGTYCGGDWLTVQAIATGTFAMIEFEVQ